MHASWVELETFYEVMPLKLISPGRRPNSGTVLDIPVWPIIASSPGLLRGEGEGRPGIHCMQMRYIFRIIYRKRVCKLIPTTC